MCDNWPSGRCQREWITAELSLPFLQQRIWKASLPSASRDFPGTQRDFITSKSLIAVVKSGSKYQRIQDLSGAYQTDGQTAWLTISTALEVWANTARPILNPFPTSENHQLLEHGCEYWGNVLDWSPTKIHPGVADSCPQTVLKMGWWLYWQWWVLGMYSLVDDLP